jgi:tRNA 2-selenouridine synthase
MMNEPHMPSEPAAAAPLQPGPARATGLVDIDRLAEFDEFDEIIDVRSEDEFAEDHIPGAVNCPVLDNAERARVGTLYKQVSPFEAKKLGAALVSANISRHLAGRFHDRPRSWRPLVYCWRGGSRSEALAHVLRQVGWRAARLDGGYKAYRRRVIADLAQQPARLEWRVVCGLTGSGKSRLLRALAACGAQVLDLEALAAHRGSVLGSLPDAPQPAQKMFESLVWNALRGFARARPIYVEAESKKIGDLRVPQALIEAMWRSPCVVLEAALPLRVALLQEEYAHFMRDPAQLAKRLQCLTGLYGHAVIGNWIRLAHGARWDELTEELLTRHYDPAYTRSTLSHYPAWSRAPRLALHGATDAEFLRLARQCLSGPR